MGKEVEYREYAKSARATAEQLKDRDGREKLLQIADAWDKMASEHKRRFPRNG